MMTLVTTGRHLWGRIATHMLPPLRCQGLLGSLPTCFRPALPSILGSRIGNASSIELPGHSEDRYQMLRANTRGRSR